MSRRPTRNPTAASAAHGVSLTNWVQGWPLLEPCEHGTDACRCTTTEHIHPIRVTRSGAPASETRETTSLHHHTNTTISRPISPGPPWHVQRAPGVAPHFRRGGCSTLLLLTILTGRSKWSCPNDDVFRVKMMRKWKCFELKRRQYHDDTPRNKTIRTERNKRCRCAQNYIGL